MNTATGTVIRCAKLSLVPHRTRALSTQTTQAVVKLQAILEQYRQANYTQETSSRFRKDIARAAESTEGIDCVAMTGLERVLINIGAANMLTEHELRSIFVEIGNDKGEIPTKQLVQLF